jgi:hypothetical protein
MSPHSDTLFWFWANQSLLLFLNAAEKQQIPILWFEANNYATDTVQNKGKESRYVKSHTFSTRLTHLVLYNVKNLLNYHWSFVSRQYILLISLI